MKALLWGLAVALILFLFAPLRADDPVIVHEWGTFTSLQDEQGNAIGGIDVDDEPVPDFVCGMGFVHSLPGSGHAFDFGLPPYPMQKGWFPADQDVTMRLETPVIYFYPPKGPAPSSVLPLTVHVDFHGGLLSQFYPYAETSGFPDAFPWNQKVYLADCNSGLTWTVTHFGSAQMPVETTDKVWTTPREVSAPEIEVKAKVADGGQWVDSAEAEHFLFYRGVGHLDSPLMVDTTIQSTANTAEAAKHDHSELRARPQGAAKYVAYDDLSEYSDSWLVEIRADGTCAFAHHDLGDCKVKRISGTEIYPVPGWFSLAPGITFSADQFATDNLTKLRASMQAALVKEGLYPDEASAMLRTWELSYFKSPGLRFFYIVPRAWVDRTLPLTITGATVQVTRVMVGRIELISDEQRAALARLASEPYPNLMDLKEEADDAMEKQKLSTKGKEEFYVGARPLTDLGITLSPSVRDYLSLGRFRDALIVHEQAQHPSANLARFIKENDLAGR